MSEINIQNHEIIQEEEKKEGYDQIQLKREKIYIEMALDELFESPQFSVEDVLQNHKKSIIRLGFLNYKLNLAFNIKQYLSKYVYPLGLDQFMESSEITFFAAIDKLQKNEYNHAYELINKSLEINRYNYIALILLSNMLQQLKNNTQSILNTRLSLLLEALVIKEDYWETHVNLAQINIELHDHEKSESHFYRAFQLQPKQYIIYKCYAEFLMIQKKQEKCIDFLMKNHSIFNTNNEFNFNFYILLSFCELKNKQYQVSLEYAQKAIDILPSDYLGYILKSHCLKNLGHQTDATQQMILSIDKKKLNSDQRKTERINKLHIEQTFTDDLLYSLVGLSYYEQNQHENSLEYFSKSVEFNNKYDRPYKYMMKIYFKSKKYDKFLDIQEQMIIHSKNLQPNGLLQIIQKNNQRCFFSRNRIESFMENILFGNINSIELISKIFDFVKNQININHDGIIQENNNTIIMSRKDIQDSIYYVLSQKYLRNAQSLLLILGYHKHIKMHLQYLSEYSIWDLLID